MRQPLITASILIGVTIIAVNWWVTATNWSLFSWPENIPPIENIPPADLEQDHILGNPRSTLFVIEYCDTHSPFCLDFHRTITRSLQDWGTSGEIARVFRHLPLLTDQSRTKALLMECVSALSQDNLAFWSFLSQLYSDQNNTELEDLLTLAQGTGLEREELKRCLDEERYASKIDQHITQARRSGARYVPFIALKPAMITDDNRTLIQNLSRQSNALIHLHEQSQTVVIEGSIEQDHLIELFRHLLR